MNRLYYQLRRGLGIAAIGIFCLAFWPPRTACADEIAAGKLFVLINVNDGAGFSLAAVEPDGTNFRTISTPKAYCLFPAASPDGKLLAYTAFDRNIGRGPSYVKLYLADADGSNAVRIADSAFHVAWSPDGDKLLVTRMIARQGQPAEWRLEVVDLDGSVERDLGPGMFASCSPVEHRIACLVSDQDNHHATLTLMNAQGTGREAIAQAADGSRLELNSHCCAWSPDGTEIAVARAAQTDGHSSAFLSAVNVRTREVRRIARLSDDGSALLTATWSPDGKSLAYAAEDVDGCRVFVVPAEGGRSRLVTPADKSCFMPVWSR